jgi:hypothetical protein
MSLLAALGKPDANDLNTSIGQRARPLSLVETPIFQLFKIRLPF